MIGELRSLALASIDRNPDQPRKHFATEPLEELADSIRSLGVLEPIVVTPAGDRFRIVAGERRWRAATLAGLAEIPAIVRELDDREAFILSMVENVLRRDMNPIEEADGYQRLIDDGLTVEDIAERTGKREPAIRAALTLRQLEPGIRELVAKGHLTPWDGTRLATLTWNGQARALDAIQRGGLTGNDRDRVIGQLWREEHEVSMFDATEVPERARRVDDLRDELERAVKALHRAAVAVDQLAGAMPDSMAVELAEEAVRASAAIAKVTRQAKVARLIAGGAA